jgi:hypothetical protein
MHSSDSDLGYSIYESLSVNRTSVLDVSTLVYFGPETALANAFYGEAHNHVAKSTRTATVLEEEI